MKHYPKLLLTFTAPLLLLGAVSAANADVFCGTGCHTSLFGACVADGWEQGARVRNECPATTRPRPPCGGPDYVWSRNKQACFPRVKDWI